MNQKEALKIISQKLEKGQSKQEIFNELISKVKFKSDLIKYIAMVPNYEDRIKYKNLNLVLFLILCFFTISKFVIAVFMLSQVSLIALPLAFLVPIITIWFAISVWNFRGNMYRPLGLIAIASVLKKLSNIDQFSTYTPSLVVMDAIFFWIPAILVIFIAFFIGFKVFPYYGFWGNLKEEKLLLTVQQSAAPERHSADLSAPACLRAGTDRRSRAAGER